MGRALITVKSGPEMSRFWDVIDCRCMIGGRRQAQGLSFAAGCPNAGAFRPGSRFQGGVRRPSVCGELLGNIDRIDPARDRAVRARGETGGGGGGGPQGVPGRPCAGGDWRDVTEVRVYHQGPPVRVGETGPRREGRRRGCSGPPVRVGRPVPAQPIEYRS